jgi:hypothetical protein
LAWSVSYFYNSLRIYTNFRSRIVLLCSISVPLLDSDLLLADFEFEPTSDTFFVSIFTTRLISSREVASSSIYIIFIIHAIRESFAYASVICIFCERVLRASAGDSLSAEGDEIYMKNSILL